jgi:hypothetical protein
VVTLVFVAIEVERLGNPTSPSASGIIGKSESKFGTDIVNTDEPRGILAKFQKQILSRKASIEALKARYDSELEFLTHKLSKACQVEKAKIDVMAEQFLQELDAQNLQVLSELGLRNKETRERALLALTESTVAKLKEVQEKDWPPTLIDSVVGELLALRKRVVDEIMAELGD